MAKLASENKLNNLFRNTWTLVFQLLRCLVATITLQLYLVTKEINLHEKNFCDLSFYLMCLFLIERGELYTTGSDEYFQLGHQKPDKKFHMIDKVKEPISTVACGAGHTIFATEGEKIISRHFKIKIFH